MNAPSAVDRKLFLGGSDVAAILGVAPSSWKSRCSPLDVYLIKTGQRVIEADADLEDLFAWGKELEPVVIKRLRRKHGVKVTKRSLPRTPNRYSDPEHPFLAAEIDFEWRVTKAIAEAHELDPALIGTIQNGEIKTVHAFASAKFGDDPQDVPVEYAAQAMHGLMVTGRQICMFGVLTGSSRSVDVYWVTRDDETIGAMRPRLLRFWNDNVLAGVPPEALTIEDVQYLFRTAPASRTEASAEILAKLEDLKRARNAKSQAEDAEVTLKLEIGKFMLGEAKLELKKGGRIEPVGVEPGHHLLTVKGIPVLDVQLQTQSRLDGERLKLELPEVAAKFQKPNSFIKFGNPKKGMK